MHPNAVWIVPLVVGGAGAVLLAAVAALVRRDVTELQRALRPLRVRDGRRGPSGRNR